MSRYAIRSSLAALGFIVAAAGLSGTAVAATDAAPATVQATKHDGKHGDRHGHHHHRHFKRHGHHHGGFMLPGVGPLSKKQIESLKLDEKQQAAFDGAKASQREFFKAMRENGGKRHALLATQLKNGKLDPHALIADQDTQRTALSEQSKAVRGKWLAAWDSLNSTQQQQVTDWVKARHEKMEARRAKMKERHEKRAAEKAKAKADKVEAAKS